LSAAGRRRGALAAALAATALVVLPATAPHRAHAAASPATVWLCRPGSAGDPCTASLRTTVISGSGGRTTRTATPAASSPYDCFYVYPTVSGESTSNADLRIQAAERSVAIAQASRFSTVCRVWAPMYRQVTLASLLSPTAEASALGVAYASLLAAWRDYIAHDNDGRPFVLIGHSQGAAMLIRLIASQVDGDAALRRRLVSAIVLGGNVTVPAGKAIGGSFRNIPACGSPAQVGCVIAYSSFPGVPPGASLFGRPGQGVSLLSGQGATKGMAVLCVNPARIGGGTAPLYPYFPTSYATGAVRQAVTTPWVEFPELYTASCRSSGGATWLQVTDVGRASDHRPRLTESDGPLWGFHVADVNVALGNLVADVAGEEAAYARASLSRSVRRAAQRLPR